ncbi:AmiR/NasT family two-component response regulator [Methanomicrobium sp. W14]|jgi:AmiR/NasT family two-component response regulator|uniref:response regulator n=1 Tax=Methanomicrobium sp. W14 TaxID=2817839 RepID=UPI001AE31511|nr:response regulator [Methanomicrobium sp. W14]MBP2133247.1 AmiR/NasT family two-component response regulator [Methanomicrobium sp. W14]
MKNGVKVLIVEDDAIISMDIEQRVKKFGCEVLGVVDRAEKVYSRIKEKLPDIVLMDINIKGESDGVSVAEKLLEDYSIHVIYITAYSDMSMKERAMKTEPLGYLVKPIRESELVEMLEYAITKIDT